MTYLKRKAWPPHADERWGDFSCTYTEMFRLYKLRSIHAASKKYEAHTKKCAARSRLHPI